MTQTRTKRANGEESRPYVSTDVQHELREENSENHMEMLESHFCFGGHEERIRWAHQVPRHSCRKTQ